MTLGELSRKHVTKDKVLELKRLVALPQYSVIGGASKLYKTSKKYAEQNEYFGIRSYNDLRWGNYVGSVYERLGMAKISESKYTPHYVSKDFKERFRNVKGKKQDNRGKTPN